MTLAKRFRLYFSGVFMGCILVYFVFGDKASACFRVSLPNGRLLDEVQYKKINYTPEAQAQLLALKVDTTFINRKILKDGDVDFGASKPRDKPCGHYLIRYEQELSDDSEKNYILHFDKCKEAVLVKDIALEHRN